MLSSRLFLSLFVAGTLIACASSSGRGSFDDTSSNDTTTPPANPPPPPDKQETSGPITPTSDASTPDAPSTCVTTTPTSKCGLVPQCGCTSAETCDVVDSTGAVDCVVAGKATMGKSCTSTAGCAVGLSCVFGTCHAFCNAPATACTVAGTGNCIEVKMTGGTAVPHLDVCMVTCDIRDANACGGTGAGGTAACVADNDGNTDCQTAPGPHHENEVCTPADDCGPGLVCVGTGAGSTSSCKRWCKVGTADCGAGKTCGGFQTPFKVGGVEFGACP